MRTTWKTILCSLTLLCAPELFGQTDAEADTRIDHTSNIIKLTPLKMAALINPAVEISYERKTSARFATQVMGGWLLPMSGIDAGAAVHPNIKGFRLAVEEKFYWKQSAPTGPYVSFEFNYLNTQYRDVWSFGVADSFDSLSIYNYPDTFSVKKQTYSFNVKFGYQYVIRRFCIDLYAGIGLRYKDVAHFDRIDPTDEMERPRHPNVYFFTNRAGKYRTVCVPLNLRVGWSF